MKTHLTAPPSFGKPAPQTSLPAMLYRHGNVDQAELIKYRQPDGSYAVWSLSEFKRESEEIGAALRALGMQDRDRVAFFLESDAHFLLADMGALIAKLIDVPIYFTHNEENVQYVVEHSGSRVLFVQDAEALARIPTVSRTAPIEAVIVTHGPAPKVDGQKVFSWEEARAMGRAWMAEHPGALDAIRESIEPREVATIIYTSGTTGRPKGVVLTHGNISCNAVTTFEQLGDFKDDGSETGLSFLPLTHIFARTLSYALYYYRAVTYLCTPETITDTLKDAKPNTFASVPRLLEKVYARILERSQSMTGAKKKLLDWAIDLAQRYDVGKPPTGLYKIQLGIADKLVYSKWREALGGNVRYIPVGGAALSGQLTNIFGAAGIPLMQGYGLTETSPVVTFNRVHRNRAGTVGEPIPGVEVKIAEDGEILVKGPNVMQGYYRDPEKTREVLTEDGWFHTGDIGEITSEGFLRITDRKKDLFKLSTGKYVTPQPIESRLMADPLIEQAVVLGADYKYTAALLFPEPETLKRTAERLRLNETDPAKLCVHPEIRAYVQALVDAANHHVDEQSKVKKFLLVPERITVENGVLTPTMKVKRPVLRERFAKQIEQLYA